MKISYDTPSQRRHHRLTIPLVIMISQKPYTAVDWSINGLKFQSDAGTAFSPGDCLSVHLAVPFQDFRIVVELKARVGRIDLEGGFVALEFTDPPARAKELLHYFSDNLLRGEMAPIDGTIKRLDLPFTSPRPEAPAAAVVGAKSQTRRSWQTTGVYLAIGLALASFLTYKTYMGLVVVSSDHAMVYTQTIDVTGPEDGAVAAVYVHEGDLVAAGDKLLSIRSARLDQLLSATRQDLGDLRIKRDQLRILVAQEQRTLGPYRKITDDQLIAAQAGLAAAQDNVTLLERQQVRVAKLAESGYASTFDVDRVETDLKRANSAVLAAQADLHTAQTAREAARYGSYYTANRLEGDLPQLQSDYAAAQDRVALAEVHLKELEQQSETLVLHAPVAGRVRQLNAFMGGAIRNGATLLSLQANEVPRVYALVPTGKLARIGIGHQAVVYVPAASTEVNAEVVAIEPRTWTLPVELRQTLGDTSNLALVILDIKTQGSALAGMTPGLPASVQFGSKGPTHKEAQPDLRLAASN